MAISIVFFAYFNCILISVPHFKSIRSSTDS